jgi:hypothetical protein
MKEVRRIWSICLPGVMLLVGCLWLLNTVQAAHQSAPPPLESKYILVDDFKDGDLLNNLGGQGECWAENDGTIACDVQLAGNDGFLDMQYNVNPPGAYALYSSPLLSLNLTALDSAWVAVKGATGSEPIYVEFKDCGLSGPPQFPKVRVNDHLAQDILSSDWSAVAIPLAEFSAITDWSCIDHVSILAHDDIGSQQGRIYVDDIRLLPAQVLVDSFPDLDPENELGGDSEIWESSPDTLRRDYVQGELKLSYDVKSTGEAVYWTKLRYTNLLLDKDAIFFNVRGQAGGEEIAVEFRDCSLGGWPHIPKIKVSDYLADGIKTTSGNVAIPLAAFADGMDWTCVDQVNILVSYGPWLNSGQGTVFVDDVVLAPTTHPIPLLIDHFDDCNSWNALRWEWSKGTLNSATISVGPDATNRHGSKGCGYRVTYDIERDGAAWLLSELRALDVTDYTYLRFFVKGASGNEELHVYLTDDTVKDRYQIIKAEKEWQEVLIPLSYFAPALDLTKLLEFKILFENRPMDGEIYLDDISFTTLETYLPIVLKDYREICSDQMPSCPSPYNSYEPNNYMCSTTSELSPGVPIQSYICAPDDKDDYYYIDVTTLNPITVRLTHMPTGVDYDLYLYFGGSIVASSGKYGNADEAFTYTPSQMGMYFIRVYPYSGHSLSPYTLQADFQ